MVGKGWWRGCGRLSRLGPRRSVLTLLQGAGEASCTVQATALPCLPCPACSPKPIAPTPLYRFGADGAGCRSLRLWWRQLPRVEVGFVLPSGHTFCTLVRPEPRWTHWRRASLPRVHHISRELIVQRGLPRLRGCARAQHRVAWPGGVLRRLAAKDNDYSWLGVLFKAYLGWRQGLAQLEDLRRLLRRGRGRPDRHAGEGQSRCGLRGPRRHRAGARMRACCTLHLPTPS